ncbi:carbohydrate ABC transporter permease [Paenibacillus cremeus]|uniref:Carbohydrate ABC transporter permease n=1 Tax=Paenibacillus cremeus TaxID=2163881 RepID=A0A559KBH9_9BACL|nr:carbohydrate ABC transporter permease [Paenibacillus cremeus]TVY09453.1 carbohydrate ABC transporter permease [Paenibacillus cremeus]
MGKTTTGRYIFQAFNGLILTLLAASALFPFVHVLARSLSDEAAIMAGKVVVVPIGMTWAAYNAVIHNSGMNQAFLFTVYLTVAGTLINLLLTVFGAYPLSKRDLIGGRGIWIFILFTMFFGGGIVPTYLVVKSLGLLNTMWALIFPVAVNTFNLIIMKTFFQGIPSELEESAKLDGAMDIGILFRIILPLSLPIIATLTLFYAVDRWNEFYHALLYNSDSSKFTLQLKLRELVLQGQVPQMTEGSSQQVVPKESLKYASIIYATVPILIVYPWLQKYFVKGALIGSLKA